MVKRMRRSEKTYPELRISPLNPQEKYNLWYGIPDDFMGIYSACLNEQKAENSESAEEYQLGT